MEKSPSDFFGPADEATTLYTQIFLNLTTHWEKTRTFRAIAELGFPSATRVTHAKNQRAAGDFLADPSNESLFINKAAFLAFVGGQAGMSETMTRTEVGAFQGAVDEASIVLAHSAVDAALTDLCRVSSLRAPQDWYLSVQARKVTLREATEQTADALLRAKIEAELKDLERASLIDRSDKLHALCAGSINPQRIGGFSFDRNRLVALDVLRHDLVHRPNPNGGAIAGIEASVDFLYRSGLYLWSQLNSKYGVQLDPAHAFRANTAKA